MSCLRDETFRRALHLSRSDFVATEPRVFFAYAVDDGGVRPGAFFTGSFPAAQRAASPRSTIAFALPPIMATAVRGPESVVAIAKSDRNPYSDRISVGRAASCDVVLATSSVSKLHAHFLLGGWSVRDAESTNGTFVNGGRLAPHVPVALRFGDRLRIAHCEGRFVDAGGLFDLLRGSDGAHARQAQ